MYLIKGETGNFSQMEQKGWVGNPLKQSMYQSQVCFMIQVISDETKANQNSLKYKFIWTILVQFQGKFDKSYPNNRGWRKKILNLIKGESLIRASRVENFSKINKQASPFIRDIRVSRCIGLVIFSTDNSNLFVNMDKNKT